MSKSKNRKIFMLIDGHALMHKGFHAIPYLSTSKGEPTNAVFGFTAILLNAIKEVQPDCIAATFDLPKPTFRHTQYAEYKAHRKPAPDDLTMQIPKVKEVTRAFNIPIYEQAGYEADDLIGTLSTKIAKDAIAFVVNNENTDTTMSVEKIKSIMLGNDSLWNQVNAKSQLGKINIVFDNNGSANTTYIKDSILFGKSFSNNAFAVKSNPEVIDYVSKNKNAIGVLSVNWISDSDDTLTVSFLKKIKVIALAKDTGSKAVKPYQAYIQTKEYPFTRDVYMINRQTRAGLGMGFVSFVAGEKGQIMILKAGLIPAISPIRLIEVNTQ